MNAPARGCLGIAEGPGGYRTPSAIAGRALSLPASRPQSSYESIAGPIIFVVGRAVNIERAPRNVDVTY